MKTHNNIIDKSNETSGTRLKETQAPTLNAIDLNDQSYCMPCSTSQRWRKRCAIFDAQGWYKVPPGEPRHTHKWRSAMKQKGVIMRYMVNQEASLSRREALMKAHESQNPPVVQNAVSLPKKGTYFDELKFQAVLTFASATLSNLGLDTSSIAIIEQLLSSMRVLYCRRDDPLIVVHTLKQLAVMAMGARGSPSVQILDFLGLLKTKTADEISGEGKQLCEVAGTEKANASLLAGASWFRTVWDTQTERLTKMRNPFAQSAEEKPKESEADESEEETIKVENESLKKEKMETLLDTVKTLNEDYDRAKETEGFGQITRLLTYALAMGLCGKDEDGNPRRNIEWSKGNLELLHVQAAKEAIDAKDLLEATLRTAKFLIERGSLAMEEKSIVPFFAGDLEKREFYSEYNFIVGCESDIGNGRLDLHNTNLIALMGRTARMIKLTQAFLHRNIDSRSAKEWNTYKLKLESIKLKCRKRLQANATRVTPWGAYFMGSPGAGKSTIVVNIAKMLVFSRGLSIDGSAIANKVSTDPYDTTIEWDTAIVLLDDCGAADAKNKEAATFFLQACSRIPYQLIKAVAEEKGATDLNCLGIIGTGNGDDAGLHDLLPNNTGAGLRRWTNAIYVDLKPEFATPTGAIDCVKVSAKYPGDPFPPIQTFTMYEPKIIANNQTGQDTFQWSILRSGDRLCTKLELGEFIPLVVKAFNDHVDRELQSIEGTKMMSPDDLCAKHFTPKSICAACKGGIDPSIQLVPSEHVKSIRRLPAHVGGAYDGACRAFEEQYAAKKDRKATIAQLPKNRPSRRRGKRDNKNDSGVPYHSVTDESFMETAGTTIGALAATVSNPKSVVLGAVGAYFRDNSDKTVKSQFKEKCPALFKTARDFYHSPFCRLTSWIPESLYEYQFVQRYVANSAEAEYEQKWKHILKQSLTRSLYTTLLFMLFMTLFPTFMVYMFYTSWEDLDGIFDVTWQINDIGLPYLVGTLKAKYRHYYGYTYDGSGLITSYFRHRLGHIDVGSYLPWADVTTNVTRTDDVCYTIRRTFVHNLFRQPGSCYDFHGNFLGQTGVDMERLQGVVPQYMAWMLRIRGPRIALACFTIAFTILFIFNTWRIRAAIHKKVFSDRDWMVNWLDENVKTEEMITKDRRRWAVIAVCALGTALTAYYSYRSSEEVSEEMSSRGFNVTQKQDIWSQSNVPEPASTGPKACTATQEQAAKSIAQNCCHITVNGKSNRAVGIRGSQILAPKHAIPIGENFVMKFNRQTAGTHTVDIHHSMVSPHPTKDCVVIDVPGHKFHDITDYFARTTFKIGWWGLNVVTPSYDKGSGQITFYEGRLTESAKYQSESHEFSGFTYHRESVLTSNLTKTDTVPADTGPGDCGTPIIAQSRTPVLVGLHNAGFYKQGAKCGVVLPITFADIDQMSEGLKSSTFYMPVSNECVNVIDEFSSKKLRFTTRIHPKNPVNFTEGAYEVLGAVDKLPSTFKTSMEPSILAEDIKEAVGPIALEPIKLNPFWEAPQKNLEKFASPWHGFDMDVLEKAVSHVHETLLEAAKDTPELKEARPLTHEENLNGIDGVWGINAWNFKTGVCWPAGCGKKEKYVIDCPPEEGIDCVKDIPGLKERHEVFSKQWANGETVGIPFVCFPKTDEVRPPGKPARMVNGCGIDLTYAVRKYFLAVSRVIQACWRTSGAVLGQNCYGEDWTRIADHLKSLDPHGKTGCLPGDFSSFDAKQMNLLLRMAWKILILFAMASGNYTPVEIRKMFSIASDVNTPIVVVCDVLVQLFGGNMSGHPLTTIINSIVNMILIVYCVFKICGVDADPEEIIRFVVLGDDSIIVSSDSRIKHHAFQEVLAQVGCKYTLDVKTSTDKVDTVPLSVATFCKRGFAPLPEGFAAPLLEESIWKSLYFTSDKKREKEILECSIINALFEWHMHGEDIFNLRRAQLRSMCDKHNLLRGVDLPTFNESYDRWLDYQRP